MKTVDFSKLEKGQNITLCLRNGEEWHGIFQFIDGDEFDGDVVLKPIDPDSNAPCLGWKIPHISKIIINQ